MSAEIRQAIADAANTVDGIHCTPYLSSGTEPGSAFVRLDHTEFQNAFDGVFSHSYWGVCLVLPQDTVDAEKFYEAKVPGLVNALASELLMTRAEPQRLLLTGVGEIPIAFVTGHREDQ